MCIFGKRKTNSKHTNLTGKCTGSHQGIKTHGSEVDPTGIEGLSNFSLVVDLVKRIKIWLMVAELNCIEVKRTRNKLLKRKGQEIK